MVSLFLLKSFVWVFIIYGISQIITEASIFSWLRDALTDSKFKLFNVLGKLVTCFLCTSVWVAFSLGAFAYSPTAELWPHLNNGANIFLDGMYGSTFAWFLYMAEAKLS